ncbi:hypothetical protein R1sor_004902 [Riccia sorocarpa]|uniref:AAA+ ATPase domain-containing protein n=1 Tax=Riccia sorocarpa TaxID=122646 RepID=A0ABD3HK80_9MARC
MKREADEDGEFRAKWSRLHSLLFGSEESLAANDSETALGLALRLLGFLDSETKTEEEETYIRQVLKVVHSTLDTARRGTSSDRENQEATCSSTTRFSNSSVDLQRIKNSKYSLPVYNRTLQTEPKEVPPNGAHATECLSVPSAKGKPPVERLPPEEGEGRSSQLPARAMMQSKITNYGRNNLKQLDRPPLNGWKPSENSKGPLLPIKTHSSAEPMVSKNVSKQSTDVVDADFVPSPSPPDGGDDKSLAAAYARKRSRNTYFDKKVPIEDELGGTLRGQNSYAKRKQAATRNLKRRQGSSSDSEDDLEEATNTFVTAKQKWAMDSSSKRTSSAGQGGPNTYQNGENAQSNYRNGGAPKSLGVRRGVRGSFVPPVRFNGGSTSGAAAAPRQQQAGADNGVEDSTKKCLELLMGPDGELPERLRNLEPKLLEHVSNEIMDQDPNVRWDDIAGLEHAKKCVTEMVIWPLIRPDLFQGCRSPGKGLLLFGPPGTGKTMIGKAIAGEAKATFFSISASSLTSKWIGEGEKLVRALFGVASCRQPAVIFIDEVDSLLSQRKADGEHESSRRLKTQFLIEMEGCGSGSERILLIGATNRPQELDEAARRRLSKRLYIPLPSTAARAWIIRNLLEKDGLMTLTDEEVDAVCTSTEGYSGSDMKNLVKEASMGPLREALIEGKDISKISKEEMRSISLQDFMAALQQVRPSVSQNELGQYEDWNRQFGSIAL